MRENEEEGGRNREGKRGRESFSYGLGCLSDDGKLGI